MPQRRAGFVLCVAAVLAVHAAVALWVADEAARLGQGAASSGPARLKADFRVELLPAAPPAAAAAAPAPRRRPARATAAVPTAVASAASAAAAAAAASPAMAPPEPAQLAPEPPIVAAQAPDPGASTPAAEPAAVASSAATEPPVMPTLAAAPAVAPSAPPPVDSFQWPRSTRLSYRLTGNYRGPVDGQGSVEWLHVGGRYQVHVEVSVGPSFAPLMSRRMSSDGVVGPEGLTPRHYDEETRVVLRSPRRVGVDFEPAAVRLATGEVVARPAGVQDTASQFVQLTWLFTTQPERLQVGRSVDMQLALARYVDLWVYDVVGTERLYTPVGEFDTWHVRPRRPARATRDLTAEVWVAPTLQYLPVRIVIRQDTDTYVDLLLVRLPQQDGDPARR